MHINSEHRALSHRIALALLHPFVSSIKTTTAHNIYYVNYCTISRNDSDLFIQTPPTPKNASSPYINPPLSKFLPSIPLRLMYMFTPMLVLLCGFAGIGNCELCVPNVNCGFPSDETPEKRLRIDDLVFKATVSRRNRRY